MMKIKRLYIPITIALIGIFAIVKAQVLLANYNIVDDIVLTVSTNTLKEGENVSLTITDANTEDTKIVIPIDENMGFIDSTNQDGSVIVDNLNHQLVIDWLDASNKQKSVTITMKANKEGSYSLKAMTVRAEQEVTSKEKVVEVKNYKEPIVENQEGESVSDDENSLKTEQTKENIDSIDSVVSGTWGTSSWNFDEETGVLTIEPGELDISDKSPWNNKVASKVDYLKIKQIIFTGNTVAPSNSNNLFQTSSLGESNIEKIEGLSYLDTSKVTSMNYMFYKLTLVQSIDLSKFNTSKVTSMSNAFAYMSGLQNLDASSFDTSKVTDMFAMFNNMSSIQNLDVSSFDTSKVLRMTRLFSGMSSIRTLDVSNFEMRQVPPSNLTGIYSGTSLTKLIVGDGTAFNAKIGSGGDGLTEPLIVEVPPNKKPTGRWTREDGQSKGYTPDDFTKNYGTGDLTAGAYVAEFMNLGSITGETKISNQTHFDGLFYVNDEIKVENIIHHKGEVWNYIYKTVIPRELVVSEESFKGHAVTKEGVEIEFPNEVFKFDESSRILEVNLKSISEPSGENNYYSAVDTDFYYDITATINKDLIGKKLKLDTNIKYYDPILSSYPDVNLSTESKDIYGLDPKWALKKEIKNLSRNEEIVAVGDELGFTITATNSEELGAMFSFDLAENQFPKELDFINGSAELVLPDGTIKKLPDSVYQPDKQIISTNVFSGNGFVGVNPYSLRFKTKVKESAYGKILETKANLTGLTHTQKGMSIDDEIVKIDVSYSGKLGFKDTPKTLSFKDSFISVFTSTIERKEEDWGISIEDTRANKQPWKLSVKQTNPFESIDGDKLTQVLIFRKDGTEDQGIDTTNEVDVYSETKLNQNDYFVSWPKKDGFFLKVPPGTAKAKQYQTEFQWNLKDTPI